MVYILSFSTPLVLAAGVLDKCIHNWDVIKDILIKWIFGKVILNKGLKTKLKKKEKWKWKTSTEYAEKMTSWFKTA